VTFARAALLLVVLIPAATRAEDGNPDGIASEWLGSAWAIEPDSAFVMHKVDNLQSNIELGGRLFEWDRLISLRDAE